MPFTTYEEYFAECTAESRKRLEQVRREVERRVPGAVRCIAYQMPAFRQERVFFYFAAFKKHIGIYPPVTQDAAIIAETAPYRGPKGNLSFPYGETLPLELIGRIAEALARQYSAQPGRKRRA